MELALQNISNDKTVRNNTVQNLNSQSLATQAKKGGQLVSMMRAIKKAIDLLGDDIVKLCTENESFKSKISSYDGIWLEKSNAKMLKQIDDEERASFILS